MIAPDSEIAAARGRYPRPFAKILLAMAALREKQIETARTHLSELVADFPQSPLLRFQAAVLLHNGSYPGIGLAVSIVL